MEKDKNFYDLLIVGAGILGLSCAYEYLERFPYKSVMIIEKEHKIFFHQSGRNSGVIHSGIYYKPGSEKAKNCIHGYKKLIELLKKLDIPYQITGKLIVTNDFKRLNDLKILKQNGEKNGLLGLKLLRENEILNYEPNCTSAVAALYVPQTGIVYYKLFGNKLLVEIEKKNSKIIYNTEVLSVGNSPEGVTIFINHNKQINGNKAIICTGVHSDKFISKKLKNKYRIFPFKGEYYKIQSKKNNLINGLIYPLPNPDFPFLGVHLTKTINGDLEAGPNAVLSLSKMKYKKLSFNLTDLISIITWKGFWIFAFKYWKIGLFELLRSYSKKVFLSSLKKLVPKIKSSQIYREGVGIRAQILSNDGKLYDDFLIEKDRNIINVINAPSPAATSCLAIAEGILKKMKV